MEGQLNEQKNAIHAMGDMFERGLFKQDEDGTIIVVEDPEEREFISSTVKKQKQEREQMEEGPMDLG